jgi:adenylylsulfate kinase-like enzyme
MVMRYANSFREDSDLAGRTETRTYGESDLYANSSRVTTSSPLPRFVEIYIERPIDALIEQDVKGLYKKALSGRLEGFSGISDPYEPPLDADAIIHTYCESPEQGVTKILNKLKELGLYD